MNFKTMSNSVTSKVGRQVLKLQKQSPAIMFGAGVVGVVATVVLASKATLKLEETLESTQEQMEQARGLRESNNAEYSDEDYKKDVAILYVRSAGSLAKLYAPALGVGIVSIGLLTGAHMTLNKRNAGLVAAYAALEKGFNQYRERVIAEVGPEKEREFRFGVDEREVYEEGENGEPIVKTIRHAASPSIYAQFFAEDNQNWEPNPDHNYFFLKSNQNYLNDRLQARGHVFLNEVYDALGLRRTKEGAVVGWLKDGRGDGHIDFGIFEDDSMERFYDFMTGREKCILLDFNVDGVIYDQI